MQYTIALLALVASVSAQTATGTPPSCETSFAKSFQIANVNVSSSASKRDLEKISNMEKRDVVCNTEPIIELADGVLTDQAGSTGNVVANHQFQFDDPLQNPRLYDAGFSVCENDTLALGGSAIFWACQSGNFSNLYDVTLSDDEGSIYDPANCYQVYLQVLPCGSVEISSAPALSASTGSAPEATAASSAPAVSAVTTSSLAGPAVPTTGPIVAPYPSGNTTAPAGTASASASAPGSATTSPLTAPASGASTLTIGSTVGVVAAAFVALAMF